MADTPFTIDVLRDALALMQTARPPQTLLISDRMRQEMVRRHLDASLYGRLDPKPLPTAFMGTPVETMSIPPEKVYDWSGCRSPARAKRRHAQGHPQRVKITLVERAYLVDRNAINRAMNLDVMRSPR